MRRKVIDRTKHWERWFAWRPVFAKTDDGGREWVWWEYVERRLTRSGYDLVWEYRPTPQLSAEG